jgi:cytochrome c-type biogenesis protein CcmH
MRQGIKIVAIVILAAVAVVAPVVGALGDERSDELDREATSVYQQVFSPFCPGRSLNDCPSSKASELKDELRAKLEAGMPSEEILKEVFQRYGDQYRTVPVFAGVGTLVWIAPIAFVALGLLVALAVSMGSKKPASVPMRTESTKLTPEAQQRIKDELAKLD